MSETGSIKFTCEQTGQAIAPFAELVQLNECRRELLRLGLLGVEANGIGFGNVSVRDGTSRNFYITGSGTGGRPELALADYARVVAYDFARNWLRCEGGAVASSESLTHAAVYESTPEARAVIHCHSLTLWTELRNKVPTTAEAVAYGTAEMAQAVRHLFQTTKLRDEKLFVMGGHRQGIVTFGHDLAEAFDVLRAGSGERA